MPGEQGGKEAHAGFSWEGGGRQGRRGGENGKGKDGGSEGGVGKVDQMGWKMW